MKKLKKRYNCYILMIEMRFKFDKNKSLIVKNNPNRGIDFTEIQEVWKLPYYEDHICDNPTQFRAIGWVKDKLYSVIFEMRDDEEGDYCHIITLWKSTKEEEKLYEENS